MQADGATLFRVVTREVAVTMHGEMKVVAQVGRNIVLGGQLDVGRQGHLPLAIVLPDPGVSRVAVSVTPTQNHWQIVVGNRNGAVMCPWGLPRTVAAPKSSYQICWPRVALRVVANSPAHYYWVLRLPPAAWAPAAA